ncbi:MAG TPA: hypothetical protein VGM91_12990 [Conexibacter sp.]
MGETTDLRERAAAFTELIRPHPHRGDLIAAGAVPLTVALLLINLRMDAAWGTGIFLVLDALACGLVLGMGVLAPLEQERPRAYQVVLQLCGLALLFVTLLRLAQVFGVNAPLNASGAAFWILTIVAGFAAWLARERRSEICTLVAGIVGTFALLSFVGWVFKPDGPATDRWTLLLAAIGLVLGALLLRDRQRRNSVYLIDAAGVALLTIGLLYLLTLLLGPALLGSTGATLGAVGGPSGWWKLVLLAGGLGLVAYSGVDREPGPGYLGFANLLAWIVLVGTTGGRGASLWFWPLVLLVVGAAMIAIGLRPRQPLPPEPSRDGRGPAPVVPVRPRSAEPAPRGPAPAPPVSTPGFAAPVTPPPQTDDPLAEPSTQDTATVQPNAGERRVVTEQTELMAREGEGAGEAPTEQTELMAREGGGEAPTEQTEPMPREGAGEAPTEQTEPMPREGAGEAPTEPVEPALAEAAASPEPPAGGAGEAPTRPQEPVVEPSARASGDAEARRHEPEPPEREAEQAPTRPQPRIPEPPARGSLWARADRGEDPTMPHRVPPTDRDAS